MRPLSILVGTLSLIISSVCLLASASPGYVAVEQLSHVPNGWREIQRASSSKLMKFRLAIYQENTAEFEQKVINLSTPEHHTYGQHMSLNHIRDFFRPNDYVSDSIHSWLEAEKVPADSINDHGGWITFIVPISQAESILQTKFYDFYHEDTGSTVTRTLRYSVPDSIYPYIHLIQPTTLFGHFRPQAGISDLNPTVATIDDLSGNCSSTITPTCLRALYQINDAKPKPDPRNRLGISGFLEEYARYSDFRRFMKDYGPGQQDANFTVTTINGGLNLQNSSQSSSEASLDIQYAASMAYNVLTTYYSTAGRGPLVPEIGQPDVNNSDNEPYLEQLHYLLNLPTEDLPAVLSTSYGEDEQSVPKSYAMATCNLFAQLGARGVSVIFSSGDSGPGGPCVSNGGNNSTRFQPSFPASCPFVTSVGGTYGINPEKAIDFSGGGFSDRFQRPSYQDATVGKYVGQLGNKWQGLYNAGGRGIPDVAAQARNYLIVDHGDVFKIGGTSASAPAFAGIVSRLNAARLENNKPRLGFLNPWLYSLNQTGFTDIVHGGSVGCTESIGQVPYASWNATPGWDPATGLGTPLYSDLVKQAVNL